MHTIYSYLYIFYFEETSVIILCHNYLRSIFCQSLAHSFVKFFGCQSLNSKHSTHIYGPVQTNPSFSKPAENDDVVPIL